MATETIERASSVIRHHGTPRERELRAYYLTHGRFDSVVTLAAVVSARIAPALSLVA